MLQEPATSSSQGASVTDLEVAFAPDDLAPLPFLHTVMRSRHPTPGAVPTFAGRFTRLIGRMLIRPLLAEGPRLCERSMHSSA